MFKTGVDKIKKAFAESPLQVIAVGALAATAVSKLMDANTRRSNAHTYKNEVARREAMTYTRRR